MKYTSEIVIKHSLKTVISKFDNVNNLKHWQRGLISTEHISGTPGSVSAKMKYSYKLGKRTVNLTETILENNLPHSFHVTYDSKGMHNIQHNYFEALNNGETKWTSINKFRASSLMLKAMILIMPASFKKQSMQYMHAFKDFVETGASVAE